MFIFLSQVAWTYLFGRLTFLLVLVGVLVGCVFGLDTFSIAFSLLSCHFLITLLIFLGSCGTSGPSVVVVVCFSGTELACVLSPCCVSLASVVSDDVGDGLLLLSSFPSGCDIDCGEGGHTVTICGGSRPSSNSSLTSDCFVSFPLPSGWSVGVVGGSCSEGGFSS